VDTTTSLFGIHAAALSLREARLDVLASNLANADTPGFKARDIDFAQALTDATNASNSANVTRESAGDDKTSLTISTQPRLRTRRFRPRLARVQGEPAVRRRARQDAVDRDHGPVT
jgi:flagellar basal-body rod protein FlgB